MALSPLFSRTASAADDTPAIAYGLVTYMWGADWDLPTLLANCKKTNCLGVELRTTHAHKVEPDLNDKQRAEVAARFADAGVTCVGIGSDERIRQSRPGGTERRPSRRPRNSSASATTSAAAA